MDRIPRSEKLALFGRCVEDAGIWIKGWYRPMVHTADLLVHIGKFAPAEDEDEEKGECPTPIIRFTTCCRSVGSTLSNVTLCMKGISCLCGAIGSCIRCINHAGLRARMDDAGRPKEIMITTMPQLDKVLQVWARNGRPIVLDVGLEVSIAFAHSISSYLKRKGDNVYNLIKDGNNFKTRMSQYDRLTAMMGAHPPPTGLVDLLVQPQAGAPQPQQPQAGAPQPQQPQAGAPQPQPPQAAVPQPQPPTTDAT